MRDGNVGCFCKARGWYEIHSQDASEGQEHIHQNPVRAGIVVDPCAYLYSSACTESPLRVIEM